MAEVMSNITNCLLPASLRNDFLKYVHETALCHAKTQQKNEAQVQLHAFWPLWKRDLRVFLASCRRCMEYHRGNPPKQGALRPTDGHLAGPGALLSIDLTGPHVMSNSFKYCLTAEDCFSKFLYLVPLRDKTAEHVARALFNICLRSGFYSAIKSGTMAWSRINQ
jgi:hypothetical protein